MILHGRAQLPDYHVQLFDESFGIRTGDIRKVTMDKQNFIWVLFPNHVQRFDGQHVKEFEFEEYVNRSFCDDHNMIWVSSGQTLYHFDAKCQEFIEIPIDTISSPQIALICQPMGEDVWILTRRGFYKYDRDKNLFYPHTHPYLGDLPFQIQRGDMSAHTIIMQASDSLFLVNILSFERSALPQPGEAIRWISALDENKALVSVWKGKVYVYDFKKKTIDEIQLEHYLPELQDNFLTVYEAQPQDEKTFLLATSKGVLTLNVETMDLGKLILYHQGKPLEGNQLFTDIQIINKDVWVGYESYGLVQFNLLQNGIGLIRNHETDPKKAWDNNARNFAQDDKGNIWVTTFDGFIRWDLQTGHMEPTFATEGSNDRLNHHSVRGIVFDGKNLILGQTNRGIWIYHPETKSYFRPQYENVKTGERTHSILESTFIEQIYTLRNGNHLVTGNHAAFLLHKKNYLVELLTFEGARENHDFAYEDTPGNIWIGSNRALYCLDSNFNIQFKITANPVHGHFSAVCEIEPQTIMAGGSKGLFKINFHDSTYSIQSAHPFFRDMQIQTVFQDPQKNLWLCTSHGLFQYHPSSGTINPMSHFESIEEHSFYTNSFLYSKEGILFLGSTRGILYLKPEQILNQKDTLDLHISQVYIHHKNSSHQLAKTGSIALRYDYNNIEVAFECPYYKNARKLKYRYKLSGLNNDWIQNGNNSSVRFHDLRPGTYMFYAGVSLNGIEWFDSLEKLTWMIHPPFWNTLWFYSLVIAGIALLLYGVYQYQLRKRLEVERLRMRIARDLHDDIGSALSNIHIISSMALKKQNENGNAHHVMTKIKDSTKTMLENMQDIVWAINPRHDSLEQVLVRMNDFTGEICELPGIDYTLQIEDHLESIKLDVSKRKDLFLIFKEAINNAVKYSDASHINIHLYKKSPGWLALVIKDNGKGFEEDKIHSGNGLKNMHDRAREMGGQVHIQSVPEQGTEVSLLVPIT